MDRWSRVHRHVCSLGAVYNKMVAGNNIHLIYSFLFFFFCVSYNTSNIQFQVFPQYSPGSVQRRAWRLSFVLCLCSGFLQRWLTYVDINLLSLGHVLQVSLPGRHVYRQSYCVTQDYALFSLHWLLSFSSFIHHSLMTYSYSVQNRACVFPSDKMKSCGSF